MTTRRAELGTRMSVDATVSTTAGAKVRLSDLLVDFSIEIAPTSAEKIKAFRKDLPAGTKVYIVSPAGRDFADIVATAKELRNEGFEPIPHVAARSVTDCHQLEDYLQQLRDGAGVTEVLVIGGSWSRPVGAFDSSLQLLETGLFSKYGMRRIGVAGHPEGHPSVSDDVLMDALRQKKEFVENSGAEFFVVTQFCFDSNAIIAWERKIRESIGALPIHVGVPGLASITGLIKYARICGIGPSVRFLTRGLDKLVKLAKTWAPDRLLTELSQHKAANPEFGMEKIHFYSFGELSLIAQWINAVRDGDIAFDQDGRNFSAIPNSPLLPRKNSKGD
jgi:methylenetetrahydrofolate reductase (NADPH)